MIKFETFPVDILDNGEFYVVLMDLPGVYPEDIDIFGDETSITVKGIKKSIKAGTFITMERFCGKFSRKLQFPAGINVSKAKARLENGVLIIEIPKIKDELFLDTSVKVKIFF